MDDPGFRLNRHVRPIEGAPPTRAQLDVLAGQFLSVQLDRSRPLWEIAVVPRLADDRRAAILGKVHHSMVDGIAAVELGMLLFDLAPDAALPDRVDWEPERAAGPLQLAAGSVVDGAIEQFRAARRVASLGMAPRKTIRIAETMRRAALSGRRGRGEAGAAVVPQPRYRAEAGAGLRADAGRATRSASRMRGA